MFHLQSETTKLAHSMAKSSGNNRQGPWPECIGLSGSDCVRLIEENAEDVRGRVHVVPADGMVTMDYRTDRVRVFVDKNGFVQTAPSRG